eukprot:6807953-Alexandrium_andersonii.AAC.1
MQCTNTERPHYDARPIARAKKYTAAARTTKPGIDTASAWHTHGPAPIQHRTSANWTSKARDPLRMPANPPKEPTPSKRARAFFEWEDAGTTPENPSSSPSGEAQLAAPSADSRSSSEHRCVQACPEQRSPGRCAHCWQAACRDFGRLPGSRG